MISKLIEKIFILQSKGERHAIVLIIINANNLVEQLLCSRYCSKFYMYINPFNPYIHVIKKILL